MAGSRILDQDAQIREEGLDKILKRPVLPFAKPGCSACLGNERRYKCLPESMQVYQ